MRVEITMMALIRRPEGLPREFDKDVVPNTKLKQLLLDLGYSNQEIRLFQLFITRSGEAEKITRNYILQENDKIFVTIPVGGGKV